MDADAIIALLKERLTISIETEHRYAMAGDGHWYAVEVSLYLGDEKIASDSTTIDIIE